MWGIILVIALIAFTLWLDKQGEKWQRESIARQHNANKKSAQERFRDEWNRDIDIYKKEGIL